SIPWGEEKGDDELGGYHLVWTRDMVNCASALMAADDNSTALRALIYLAVTQREDGGFYQNFWIDGRPYWSGIQLDEVSFPLMLAWRLHQLKALRDFDPYHMVLGGAGFLIREGPHSPQERWEEAAGFSPSTLAASIAALVCASDFARERGDAATAKFLEEHADFVESHIEAWTVTTQGTLVPGISRHYIRVNPPSGVADGQNTDEDPNVGVIKIANRAPDLRDRKSTRLNSSHRTISYAVFCLKKKKKNKKQGKKKLKKKRTNRPKPPQTPTPQHKHNMPPSYNTKHTKHQTQTSHTSFTHIQTS